MSIEIEMIADYGCRTGEGPMWHSDEKLLYWTDIPAGRLFSYDPATGNHAECYHDRPVGAMTVQADGALLLFRDKGNVVSFRDGRIVSTLIESIPGLESTRFNDVIADPEGRVFAGTMSFDGEANGRLYRIDPDGSYRVVSDGHRTPNGMGFSPDEKLFYLTDSRLRRIFRFDYEAASGAISNQTLFTETSEADAAEYGRSDGMTVDAEGNIWSGRWDGHHILCYAPDGSITTKIPMPARKISCVTFGGDDFLDLYATSAGGDLRDADPGEGANAGALFRLRPGVRGRAEFRSRIGL